MSGNSDLFDVTVQLHASTDKAIKVSNTGIATDAVWLPKSQVEIEDKGKGVLIVTAPTWLLRDKELI